MTDSNGRKTTHSRKDKPQLLFLVGPPRSGTTWLQSLLGNHPDIGTAQESHLFNHFLGPMVESWDHMLSFQDGRGGIGLPAYQTEVEFLTMLEGVVHSVLSRADEYHRYPIFLEKTPDHIRNMDHISRILPDAKIIYMIRSPADVIESMLSASASWGSNWAPGNIIKAIRQYSYFVSKGTRDYALANPETILLIRYEDLKKETETVLRQVLDFVGLDSSDAVRHTMLNTEFELKKYGEFAIKNGHKVVEPEGFARAKKGRLGLLQKLLVKLTLSRYINRYGYR